MRPQQGLTLIEFLFALTVLALVCGLALPALANARESARSASARGDLLTSLVLAAGRAAVSGNRAVLCPSPDGTACSDDPDWSRGWLVFLDSNASRELEGGEPVLRRQPPLPGRVHLRSSVGRTRIVFQGNGGNAGSNATFTLCDGRGPARGVSLVMANDGRLRDGVPDAEALAKTCPR
jgi:type IV fimbrial biogenesis protein FimT